MARTMSDVLTYFTVFPHSNEYFQMLRLSAEIDVMQKYSRSAKYLETFDMDKIECDEDISFDISDERIESLKEEFNSKRIKWNKKVHEWITKRFKDEIKYFTNLFNACGDGCRISKINKNIDKLKSDINTLKRILIYHAEKYDLHSHIIGSSKWTFDLVPTINNHNLDIDLTSVEKAFYLAATENKAYINKDCYTIWNRMKPATFAVVNEPRYLTTADKMVDIMSQCIDLFSAYSLLYTESKYSKLMKTFDTIAAKKFITVDYTKSNITRIKSKLNKLERKLNNWTLGDDYYNNYEIEEDDPDSNKKYKLIYPYQQMIHTLMMFSILSANTMDMYLRLCDFKRVASSKIYNLAM